MNQRRQKEQAKPGLLSSTVSAAVSGLIWVGLAVLGSIVIELSGVMLRLWDSQHAARLLAVERGYLSNINYIPMLDQSPNKIVDEGLDKFDSSTNPLRRWIEENKNESGLYRYLLSSLDMMKLIFLRLVTCLFSLPGYFLIAFAAVIDGLVQRDIRKFTGGYESSYIFHKAKRWVIPSVLGTISLYLLMPFSLRPSVVFAPSMVSFGFILYVATSRFKKFL